MEENPLKNKERMKTYTILVGEPGSTSEVRINEEGAKIIWQAYESMPGGHGAQTMEERQARGAIAYAIEIELFKKEGYLPKDFDYKKYIVENN